MNRSTLVQTFTDGSNSFDILGYIAWWNVRNVDLTRDELVTRLQNCGLSEAFARVHNYRSAFIRALKDMEAQRIIRKVEENTAKLVYQFTAENLLDEAGDDGIRLQYDPETVVVIDKDKYRKTQVFAECVTSRADIKDRVVDLFNDKKERYNSSDMTRIVQRIFNSRADFVALREQGGVYFIPAEFVGVLQSVSNLVNSVGNSNFQYMPLPNVENSRAAVSAAINDEMHVDLTKLDEEIDEMINGKEVSDNWCEHRVRKIQNLKERVERYSELLDTKAKNGFIDKFDIMRENLTANRVLDL